MILGRRAGLAALALLVTSLVVPGMEAAHADVSPPSANAYVLTSVGHPGFLLDSTARVRVAAFPGSADGVRGTGISEFNVRVSYSPMLATAPSAWRYPADLQHLPGTSEQNTNGEFIRTITVGGIAAGQHFCVSTQARDGRSLSPWSDAVCVTRMADQRVLTRSGSWRRLRDGRYLGGTALSLGHGGRLSLHGVPQGSAVSVLESPGSIEHGTVVVTGRGARRRVVLGESCNGLNTKHRFRRVCVPYRLTGAPGTVTLRPGRTTPSFPVDGIAVQPPWVQTGSF